MPAAGPGTGNALRANLNVGSEQEHVGSKTTRSKRTQDERRADGTAPSKRRDGPARSERPVPLQTLSPAAAARRAARPP